jgi:hypothetical protein
MACSRLRRPRFMTRLACGVTLLLLSAGVFAANAVPSCYQATGLQAPTIPPDRELFVLIDQTTIFDETLKRTAEENVVGFLGPNSSYQVIVFSAFSQGRYTTPVIQGTIEPTFPVKERDSVSERRLAALDKCLAAQAPWAKRQAVQIMTRSFAQASPDLAKSDILAAIRDVALAMAASPAKRKVLFLVSDMLENSSITSFYGPGGRVRLIAPNRELALTAKADMFAQLNGATVDVMGAGLLAPDVGKRAGYRDPKTMEALRTFWQQYFVRSGGAPDQFGEPDLLAPIK